MKRLLQIVGGSSDKKLNESVSFNMSVSGDTSADVADTFNKIMGLSSSTSSAPMPAPTMPSMPPMAKTIGIVDKMHGSEMEEESWANQDDPEYKDVDYMTKDLAGGLNRPKKMVKHSYKQGDNPMAMEESLMAEYQKFKLGE